MAATAATEELVLPASTDYFRSPTSAAAT